MMKSRIKKMLFIGCILLLSFALFACGSKPNNDDKEKNPPKLDTASEKSVVDFYNRHSASLLTLIENSNENTSGIFTGDFNDISFSVNEFTCDGEGDSIPELIMLRDGTFFISGTESETNGVPTPFTLLAKMYNDGVAVIASMGGETVVEINNDSSNIYSTDSYDIKELLEAIKLTAKDISPAQNESVYLLESTYVKGLTEALGLTDDHVSPLGLTLNELHELTFTLDFSDYDEIGTVMLSVSGEALEEELVLTADFSEYSERDKNILLSFEFLTLRIEAALAWEDTALLKANLVISDDEKDTVIEFGYENDEDAPPLPKDTPSEDCNSLYLYLEAKQGGKEKFRFELNAAKLQDNGYAGEFILTMKSAQDLNLGLIPLSSAGDSLGEIQVYGDFNAALNNENEIDSLELYAEVEIEEAEFALQLRANPKNAKKVGGEVARMQLTFTGGGSAAVENEMLLTLTTKSYAENRAEFSLEATLTGEGEESTLTATLHFPAEGEISLNEQEEKYLSRADALFDNYDTVMQKARLINERALEFVQTRIKSTDPLKYYYYDSQTKQYFFTDITVKGNQAYVSTNCVINYEAIEYFYAPHDGTFTHYSQSDGANQARSLQILIDKSVEEHYVNKTATYLVSAYLPEKDIYLVMLEGKPWTVQFYKEPPTKDITGGYVLHEITYSEDGKISIHNFDEAYDEFCRCTYTCRDCGFEMCSINPIHKTLTNTEIRKGNGEQSRVDISACDNCGAATLIMTDSEGRKIKVLLESVKNFFFENAEQYSKTDLVIKGFKHPSNEEFYQGILDIPRIDLKTDYRIVGAVCPENMTSSLPEVLILPEGLEFINYRAFYGCGFTSITLPSSLIRIESEAFENCRAKEIVIGENVKSLMSDSFSMKTLEKMTVNARYIEVFPIPSNAPNLNELVFNGQIHTIVGTSTLTFETLVIPEGVVFVEAFHNNEYLKKVVLPSTLTSINNNAFANCTALEEVVLPAGLLSIGDAAFAGCKSLNCVWVAGTDESDVEDGRFILPDTLTNLGAQAFSECTAMQSVYMSKSLNVISGGAFQWCTQLTEVEMHDAITGIEANAFANCNKLSSFYMPENLTAIGERAFSNCLALTDENLTFGNELKTIDNLAFENCTGIRNLRLPASMTSIDGNAFEDCQLDTVLVLSKIHTDFSVRCWGATADELTLKKGFSGKLPLAKTINIMSTDVPEGSPYIVTSIPSWVRLINFAGTQEAWEIGNYSIASSTEINFNVVFNDIAN